MSLYIHHGTGDDPTGRLGALIAANSNADSLAKGLGGIIRLYTPYIRYILHPCTLCCVGLV